MIGPKHPALAYLNGVIEACKEEAMREVCAEQLAAGVPASKVRILYEQEINDAVAGTRIARINRAVEVMQVMAATGLSAEVCERYPAWQEMSGEQVKELEELVGRPLFYTNGMAAT